MKNFGLDVAEKFDQHDRMRELPKSVGRREPSGPLPADLSTRDGAVLLVSHVVLRSSLCVKGQNMAKIARRRTSDPRRARPTVHYDEELMELQVDCIPIKRLDIRATDQIALLTEFQREGWRDRIVDPLTVNGSADRAARLRQAIRRLNSRQNPQSVRFFADGTGHGIRWEFVKLSITRKNQKKRIR